MNDGADIEAAISEATNTIEEAIGRVESGLNRVERAIKDRPNYVNYIIWGALGWLLLEYVSTGLWHSQTRYAIQYGIGNSKVSIQKRPHDCDFLTAPMGNKNCHYERQVSTLRWATSTNGVPIVSFDEGKTWSTFTPDHPQAVPKESTIEQVYVGWDKKDGDQD